MKLKFNWDALGIVASIACAVHCAILPIFLTSLPLFGKFDIIDNQAFELGMIVLAFFIGAYSLTHGFKKHHHKKIPVFLFVGGIALLVIKQVFHQWQYFILPPAVLCIVSAHIINYRFCQQTNRSCNH